MSKELLELRGKIDAIDAKIVALLLERVGVVKQVGLFKERTVSKGKSFIRSGREAEMLRKLTAQMKGAFPPAAIETIWRVIISTSLSLEQAMTIGAYISDSCEVSYWRAREYFGSFTSIICNTDPDIIIRDLNSGKLSVGVFPLFDKSKKPWWDRPKDEVNDLYVFALIPFVNQNEDKHAKALALAKVTPEETGDDVSIVAVTECHNQKQLESSFVNSGLDAEMIERSGDNYLFNIRGYLANKLDLLKQVENNVGGASKVRFMGCYAMPIELKGEN